MIYKEYQPRVGQCLRKMKTFALFALGVLSIIKNTGAFVPMSLQFATTCTRVRVSGTRAFRMMGRGDTDIPVGGAGTTEDDGACRGINRKRWLQVRRCSDSPGLQWSKPCHDACLTNVRMCPCFMKRFKSVARALYPRRLLLFRSDSCLLFPPSSISHIDTISTRYGLITIHGIDSTQGTMKVFHTQSVVVQTIALFLKIRAGSCRPNASAWDSVSQQW